ncbi:2-succinyl-6-hydroxy-2,4-cyclohexadiene-1-carboxylate synthase [Tepidibacillus infernus]|uniref:2-succinyl-6-hydroxy-2, 4-cyclohexadiene-1-carboxylate synthase n=1 Tax=Tepidibacillus infernus TaxID=1806172 RepID=UPI003A177C3E
MRIEVNQIYYHVKVVGQGPTLMLLHGFTGSMENWEPLIQALSPFYQLVLVDILGHGQSDSPSDPNHYDIEQISDDLHQLLNQLNVEKTHLLGYSMGGRLALTFAIKYPDRVFSLILESASPGIDSKEEREERRNKDRILADFIEEKGIEAFVDYWGNIPLFSTQKQLPKEVQQRIRFNRLKNNPLGLANSLRGMGTGQQPSWWDHLSQFELPVLIITGEKDEKFCRIGQQMANRLRDSKHIIVEHAGHTVHLEQPAQYINILKNHLALHKTKEDYYNGY